MLKYEVYHPNTNSPRSSAVRPFRTPETRRTLRLDWGLGIIKYERIGSAVLESEKVMHLFDCVFWGTVWIYISMADTGP